jgi:uncharacterized protein YecE (DUF72 family)
MSVTKATIRIGTSGYQYDHWKGVFYPKEIPKKHWFAYYATHFDTVEINNTFYRLPQDKTFEAWREQAPPGFCYALKFSRYASHFKRLQEPHEPINRFLGRARRLQEFLGPILIQLPPHWNVDSDRLADFLKAASGAHRWAVEFRDPRWLCGEIYAILQHYNAALCIHDLIHNHPRHITANWVYLRFHGASYGGSYPQQVLKAQARHIAQYVADGLDVFAYFNNDAYGYAVQHATDLKHYLREMRLDEISQ